MHDITKRKQFDDALKASEMKYLDLYNNAPVAYLSVGVDGNIISVNRLTQQLTGFREDELLGKPVLDLYADTPSGKIKARCVLQKFKAGEVIIGEELQMQNIAGTVFWISLTVNVMKDINGVVSHSRSAFVDITDRKRLEEEKDKIVVDLQQALSEVKKLSGFLPICASCKKIRDDTGYWNEIEKYISERSEALFSHSICPDCLRKLYPEEADEILGPLEKDQEK